MEDELESLMGKLNEVKDSPKKRIKWICPVCDGATLNKEKILQSNMDHVDVQVSTGLGELVVEVDNEENVLKKSTFPIRYCPWCGRKIREKYRKSEEKNRKVN